MSTLSELLAAHTRLPAGAVAHLQRVVAEWQLLADMSFADFLLWVPVLQGTVDRERAEPSRSSGRPDHVQGGAPG
ncbi:MAG: histidine kinase N-terminal domain-containing protein, partial [Pseudonocardia sp.]